MATTTHISSQSCHQLEDCVRLFSAYSRHYTFRNLVRSWSSSSKTTFSFFLSTVGWCRTRWETYLEHRAQAKGSDGPTLRRTLRHLPRSVPQSHRWFLLKVHLNAPIASARLVAARIIVEEPVQCCFCSRSFDSLDHLPRCFTVLNVYNSIRDAAILPPIIDGRHSPMLQERWKGSVLASIIAFFFLPFGQSDRCTSVESISSHSSN